MNYINNSLDSDLYITDGIYFVKNTHRFDVLDSNSVLDYDNSTFRSSRTGRAVDKLVTITDNNIENTTEPFTEEPAEEEFTNFIKSVEKVEKDIENTDKYETTTEIPTNSTEPNAPQDEEEPEHENLVIRSLNKVTDILYDKTTDYLSTHDLKLDLPQTLFGGAKVRVSPRGFDSDGGIILKLNVDPAERPRSYGIAKYFRKYS